MVYTRLILIVIVVIALIEFRAYKRRDETTAIRAPASSSWPSADSCPSSYRLPPSCSATTRSASHGPRATRGSSKGTT